MLEFSGPKGLALFLVPRLDDDGQGRGSPRVGTLVLFSPPPGQGTTVVAASRRRTASASRNGSRLRSGRQSAVGGQVAAEVGAPLAGPGLLTVVQRAGHAVDPERRRRAYGLEASRPEVLAGRSGS